MIQLTAKYLTVNVIKNSTNFIEICLYKKITHLRLSVLFFVLAWKVIK